jgi:uncharacterized oxidoreductase
MPRFKAEELEQIAVRVLRGAAVPSEDAQIVARHLVEANLAGHDSHGILRIPQYVEAVRTGKVVPGVRPKVLADHGCTAALDGQRGFGQVIAGEAIKMGIEKAKQSGIAAISFRNSYHTGRIASYTTAAAREDLVCIAMVNAGGGGQSVAPFGGLKRRLATNPLSIAAPSGNSYPIVLDIATSVAPEGKIRDYWMKKKELPQGWIINSEGNPSSDPNDFYDNPAGALLPLGGSAGYKGFGLAFMVDILAGALSGAGCCRSDVAEPRDGLLLIVLDVQKFIPLPVFQTQVLGLIEHVKSCPVAPGFKDVYVPGEVEHLEEKRKRTEGLEVDQQTWGEINLVARELKVDLASKLGSPTALAA